MNSLSKRIITLAALFGSLALVACAFSSKNESVVSTSAGSGTSASVSQVPAQPQGSKDAPREAQILIECYPQFIKGYSDNKLLLKDGTSIVWDDGKKKSFVELLNNCDPQDMFAFKYDRSSAPPAFQQDAGRNRCEALYKKMYGASDGAVRANCVTVNWFGQRLPFNKNNGAADSLRAVAAELAKHPELKKYLKSAGTMNWRVIAGTKRLSPHSFATAIDIGVGFSHYWQWSGKTQDENARVAYKNSMPLEIAKIFERHGFIWGGHWYHYDTMHYEFRPDILKANP